MKNLKYIFIVLFFIKTIYAQKLDYLQGFEKYYRPSITFLFLDQQNEKYNAILKNNFSKIIVKDKFNNHNLYNKSFITSNFSNETSVSEAIKSDDIPKKIVAKWYNQQQNGSFSMDFIAERGLYNASDYDVMRAKAGARGEAELEDAGENLIKKSYILVLDFSGVETWDDYYDRLDAQFERIARAKKERAKKSIRSYIGYRGSSVAYLYKVNWDDSTQQIFYEKAWNSPMFFKNMPIDCKHIETISISNLDGKHLRFNGYLSDNQLAEMLIQDAASSALLQFSKDKAEFRVKTSIFSTNPITAKVGKKESVYIDQPFFVYELEQGINNIKIPVKKGVIRATKKNH